MPWSGYYLIGVSNMDPLYAPANYYYVIVLIGMNPLRASKIMILVIIVLVAIGGEDKGLKCFHVCRPPQNIVLKGS